MFVTRLLREYSLLYAVCTRDCSGLSRLRSDLARRGPAGIQISKSRSTQSRCIFHFFSRSRGRVSLWPWACNDQGLTTTIRAATARERTACLRARLRSSMGILPMFTGWKPVPRQRTRLRTRGRDARASARGPENTCGPPRTKPPARLELGTHVYTTIVLANVKGKMEEI